MSSLDDVQNAMVNVIDPALYPNGDNNPSIIGKDIYIFAGDPIKEDLDSLLASQKVVVAVFAVQGMSRNTTRLRDTYQVPIIQTPTLVLTVSNNTITITGTVTVGQTAAVIVNGTGYAYMAITGDNLNTIATHLAALIPTASAVNNVITVNNAYDIVARVSTPGTMRSILHSEEGIFRARVIASNNNDRDAVGNAIQLAFAIMDPRYYLQMPDAISASIRPQGIKEINTYELPLAFVRDYLYLVEYHTVITNTYHTIVDAYTSNTVNNLPISS